MKSRTLTIRTTTALIGVFAVCSLLSATAQTFAVLKGFSPTDVDTGTNYGGANPTAGLTLSGGTLYGTTPKGGSLSNGTVFAMSTNGGDFNVLVNFDGESGRETYAGLAHSSGALYGTTFYGGTSNVGTVFRLDMNGTGYAVLKHFGGTFAGDGAGSTASPIISGNTLYGTTQFGGTNRTGTVFRMNLDGTDYAVLKTFSALAGGFPGTNSEGAYPSAELTLSGSTLYGIAYHGGSSGVGTVFKMQTNGTDFAVIKTFVMTNIYLGVNSDGADPFARLTLSGETLYGTTLNGGSFGAGTVFKLKTNGTDFAVIKNFNYPDGAAPFGGVTLSSNTLYGTTSTGGSSGSGTVFKVNADGTGFISLKHFSATVNGTNSDGANPHGALVFSAGTLYGTTLNGGSSGNGVVFKLTILPNLNLQLLEREAVLSWFDSSFSLQAAPSLTGAFTNIPGATSPYTNPATASQQFFRLISN